MSDPQQPGTRRWFVLGIIMTGTFMAILDSSIVNVALPHMMSAFGVNRDKIEWVSTAFMIATAVAMPLVGWLVSRFGFKSVYLTALFLFTLGSAACAFAWSYQSLIGARVLQAVGGGAIQPVGMAIVANLFAPEERGRALGIWGTGVMIGPALGPTLGGYLTQWFNWRAIFTVNLPIGFLALVAGLMVMGGESTAMRRRLRLDIWGFCFLSMALVAGLLAFSNGQEKGWSSNYILTCFGIALAGMVIFLAVEATVEEPLLDLSLFRFRNFSLSMALALFRAVGLFGGMFLLPLFLENLAGYTTIQTGLRMIPAALTVGLTMPIAGRMADRYPPRVLVTFGTALTSASLFLYGKLDPLSSTWYIVWPQIIRGIGLAFMMAPLITAAINSVPTTSVPTASSFLNVVQRVGGAFGIAVLNTYVTNSAHRHAVRIGELLPVQSHHFQQVAEQSSQLLVRQAYGVLADERIKALALSAKTVLHRAEVMAFQDGFAFAGVMLLVGIPLCLMLQSTVRRPTGARPDLP